MSWSFEGEIALVTGGSRGIGKACALARAKAGAEVIVNYVSSPERAEAVCNEIRQAGGKASAFKLSNALQLIDISNNLGDAKSLLTHPETTTHQKMTPQARAAAGVTSGLLRLSVGLEDTDDLCEDLEQALKVA